MLTVKPYQEVVLMTAGTILDAATRLMIRPDNRSVWVTEEQAIDQAFKMYDKIVNRLLTEAESAKENLTVKDAFNG